MSRQMCKLCDEEFEQIANHWRQSSCGYPSPTSRQKQILTGMLLGDAYINEHSGSGNCLMRAKMVNIEFLEWLHSEISELSANLSVYMTQEESFVDAKKRLPNEVTSLENYSEIYEYRTVRHPYFNQLRQWYSSGEKRFPENLSLTDTTAKVWYCCDGSWDERISIYAKNENDRVDYLKSLFPVGEPRWQSESNCIRFTREDSKDVLDWMGEPLPGFEYKWGK